MSYRKLLVTGGLGFIGSSYIRIILKETDLEVVNLDLMTYAANPATLREFETDPRYTFLKGDIADPDAVKKAVQGCDAVLNFAAETHVDRSIQDAAPFTRTNVEGVRVLLEAARAQNIRFLQVSTDEVYGEVMTGLSTEDDAFRPRSPYSASKAGGDLLVQAYGTTYGMDVVTTRGSNNYGPYQFPEKIIPLFITNASRRQTAARLRFGQSDPRLHLCRRPRARDSPGALKGSKAAKRTTWVGKTKPTVSAWLKPF